MKRKLFTCMFDYLGGTYIQQVRAKNVDEAIHTWVNEVDIKEVYGMGEKSRTEIERQLEENKLYGESPSPINECQNIWIDTFPLPKGFGILHIILTEENKP